MSNKRLRRTLVGALGAFSVGLALTAAVGANSASADVRAADCENPTITITETVQTDPGSEAIPAVPGFWANFQPNDQQAPFGGPPSYPSDPRGSWIVHNDGGPGQDQSGVYNIGNPAIGGNWFFRQQAQAEVPAVPPTFEEVEKEIPNPDFPCVNPKPKPPKKPDTKKPPETTTINKPDKVIKITEDEAGNVVREVTEFEGPMVEEGL